MRIINGKIKTAAMFVGVLAVLGLIAGGVYYAATNYTQGSIAPGEMPSDSPETTPTGETNFSDGPWSDSRVKKNVQFNDLNGDYITSATIHKFSEKPTNSEGETVWCGMEQDDVGTYKNDADEISVSSDTTTVEDFPGKYYLYVESSGKYSECVTMTIPDGDEKDLPLFEYEKDPEFVRPTPVLADHYKPTGLSVDLGVDRDTNSTLETWEEHAQIDPARNSETRFEKIVASIGDVDYTTDADNSKPSDEGIQLIHLDMEGADSKEKRIYYYPDGVDKLDDNNEFTWEVDDVVAKPDSPVDVGARVKTLNTATNSSNAADGDEILTDGENFLDLVAHFDNGGQTSAIDVTG